MLTWTSLLTVPSLVRAQVTDLDQARQHYAQGEALFEAENYEGALAEMQSAYDLLAGQPSQAVVLYNIGQCYERLFRYERALASYQRYLDEAGEAAEDVAEVRARMSSLEGLLATIHIVTNVGHAEVWIDGSLAGDAPGTVLVPGGRHTIELRAPGYLPAQHEVQVAARATAEENVTLEVIPVQTGIDPVWFALSTGVAVAFVGVATGYAIYAVDLHAALDGDVIEGAQRRVDEVALTADVLGGTAALFAVTAVTLAIFTQWTAPAAPTSVEVAMAPTVGGAAVVARGHF